MECANTHALNNHLKQLEKQEKALESFTNEIEPYLVEIDEMISKLREIAKDYQGYSFDEELTDTLKDTLGV